MGTGPGQVRWPGRAAGAGLPWVRGQRPSVSSCGWCDMSLCPRKTREDLQARGQDGACVSEGDCGSGRPSPGREALAVLSRRSASVRAKAVREPGGCPAGLGAAGPWTRPCEVDVGLGPPSCRVRAPCAEPVLSLHLRPRGPGVSAPRAPGFLEASLCRWRTAALCQGGQRVCFLPGRSGLCWDLSGRVSALRATAALPLPARPWGAGGRPPTPRTWCCRLGGVWGCDLGRHPPGALVPAWRRRPRALPLARCWLCPAWGFVAPAAGAGTALRTLPASVRDACPSCATQHPPLSCRRGRAHTGHLSHRVLSAGARMSLAGM